MIFGVGFATALAVVLLLRSWWKSEDTADNLRLLEENMNARYEVWSSELETLNDRVEYLEGQVFGEPAPEPGMN